MTCIICGDTRHNAYSCPHNASVANDGSTIAKLQHEMWNMEGRIKFIEGTINGLARSPNTAPGTRFISMNEYASELWMTLAYLYEATAQMRPEGLVVTKEMIWQAVMKLSERGAERVE